MRLFSLAICLAQLSLLVLSEQQIVADEPAGARVSPWTKLRIKGTPDPPLPYKAERVFSKVQLFQPTDVVWLPEAQRWIATQVDGTIVSFKNDPMNAVAKPFFNLNDLYDRPDLRAFATAFHHDLAHQPWCYIVYSPKQNDRQGTHLVRFKIVDPTVPKIDPSTRVVLASWNSSGHAGSCMRFGPDGYFYVSVGDGQNPYPPDALNTGQDLSDLESSIMTARSYDSSPIPSWRAATSFQGG